MNRLNRYAVSILGLSVMVAIIAGVNATPTQAGPTVSGIVNIGNTPLPVTLPESPLPVTIGNTPVPVTLANAPSQGTPLQFTLVGEFNDGSIELQQGSTGSISYNVTQGSSFRVDFISCRAVSQSADNVRIALLSSPSELAEFITPAATPFPLVTNPDGHVSVVNQEVNAYAPSGRFVLVAQRNSTAGFGAVTCFISGETFN
ncbi:MAG: hypothetical protein LAN64_08540 [Acidobacteriia bacterium]|nr:hypothetical protein [Terriglobia bacterium]